MINPSVVVLPDSRTPSGLPSNGRISEIGQSAGKILEARRGRADVDLPEGAVRERSNLSSTMPELRSRTLSVFRQLMRASGGFTSYNFREYALRRVRHGFRENIGVSERRARLPLVHEAERQLEMVRRQAMISQRYPQPMQHVMEQ
jgi:hypothetical protein